MKKISILIPVYNEEDTIISLLKSVQKEISKIKNVNFEIIVIDDCSNDNTSKLLRENENLFNHVISLEKNQGKGGAILKGLEKAKGEFILFQDADLEYSPKDYKTLIRPIVDFDVDVVMGSRENIPLIGVDFPIYLICIELWYRNFLEQKDIKELFDPFKPRC